MFNNILNTNSKFTLHQYNNKNNIGKSFTYKEYIEFIDNSKHSINVDKLNLYSINNYFDEIWNYFY